MDIVSQFAQYLTNPLYKEINKKLQLPAKADPPAKDALTD